MPCVNDEPEFCEMAAQWADKHIGELLSAEALTVNPTLAVGNLDVNHHHHDHGNGHHHHH